MSWRNEPLKKTSYGIITFHINENNEITYHIVQRRDTISYIKFVRGKTNVIQKDLYNAFCLMTEEEKIRLISYSFKDIWNDMYNYNSAHKRTDFVEAFKKFERLSDELIKLHELTLNKNHSLEWGIPKGRKRRNIEPGIICALREYKEETKSKSYLDFININPFKDVLEISPIEIYTSIFYVAQSKYQPEPQQITYNTGAIIRPFISEETNDVKWATLQECKTLLPLRIYSIIEELDSIIKKQFKIVSLSHFI